VTENFFHLPDFALSCAGDLFADAFAFHVGIVRGASGNFFCFAFGLAAGAFRSISYAALHNYFPSCKHVSAASGRALPELGDLAPAIGRQQLSFVISGRRLSGASGGAAIEATFGAVFVKTCKGAFVDSWEPVG
jgi:hypothetical protein